MEVWDMKTDAVRGNRTFVKVWPTGKYRRKRYRMLMSSWFNTGNWQRDHYFGRMELQKRIADLKASWDGEMDKPRAAT